MASERRTAAGAVALVAIVVTALTPLVALSDALRSPAWAAASIAPAQVDADQQVTFTVSTSLDRPALTVEVRTTVPPLFDVQACTGPSGWGCSVQPAADGTTVSWQRQASLNPTDDTFTFRAMTPSQPGRYLLTTTQDYSDGGSTTSSPTVTVAVPPPPPEPTPEPSVDPSPTEPTPTPTPEPVPADPGAGGTALEPLRPPREEPGGRPVEAASPQVEAVTPPTPVGGRDRVGRLFVTAVVALAGAAVGGTLLAAANR